MAPNGSGNGLDNWSLDDLKHYLTLQRYLPKNGGLFGSGWARFMADRENAESGTAPSFMLNTPQKPLAISPWATLPIMPQTPRDASPFGPQTMSASPMSLHAGAAPPLSVMAGGPLPKARAANVSQLSAPLGSRPAMQASSAAKLNPPIDPSRTDVFQRGPDGKLHPIPGWRTTGPFDLGTWSHNIDWNGVGRDVENIGTAVATIMTSGAPAALEALALDGIARAGVKGAIHAHHVDPVFMGGRVGQETYDLIAQFHRKFHVDLQAALKGPGVPRVGGRGGSRENWAEFFNKNPEARDKAVEILRRVSRDFDIEHGTSILPALEKELRIAARSPKAPPHAK